MRPLHDEEYFPVRLIIQTGKQRTAIPIVHFVANNVRTGVLRLNGVINNQPITPTPGKRSVNGGGEPPAAGRRLQVRHSLAG